MSTESKEPTTPIVAASPAPAPAPAPVAAPVPSKVPYSVGENVLVKGTGSWWGGRNFLAKVVDIRGDESVKIRYADGGFKRFSKAEFETLISPYDNDNSLNYGSFAFELDAEQYDPQFLHSKSSEAMQSLQTQLKEAVYRRDFRLAHSLQQQIANARDASVQLQELNSQIKEAVARQDFVRAAELQDQINQLLASNPSLSASARAPHVSTAEPTASSALPAAASDSAAAAGVAAATISGAAAAAAVSSANANAAKKASDADFKTAMHKAAKRALGGGLAGATAMAMQVFLLMSLRTTMNYQYRYGTSMKEAVKTLWAQGGIRRFYKGLVPALLQGPLSRFGDTAANAGVLALLNSQPGTADLPVAVKTLAASGTAAAFRILLMPIDTVKTIYQVEGANAMSALQKKFRAHGPSVLFHGAMATWLATLVGHYPWFATFNYLDHRLPVPEETLHKLARNALVGFCSSVVSDTVSNSVRVVKTYRQTSTEMVSYPQAVKNIIASDGLKGLFGRGLSTRLLANGTQGLIFSVLWKHLQSSPFFAKISQ